jgi:hypothetical protein
MKDVVLFVIILFIYKPCTWIYLHQGTVIKMVFNNKSKFLFFQINLYFKKGKKHLCTLLKNLED